MRPYREPEYRRRIREQAEKQEQNANDERDHATKSADIHKIIAAIKTIDAKYDREDEKQNARQKWDRFWEVLSVVGLWLAAAVGVAAIIYGTLDAERQRGVMEGQLNEMQAIDRPWISVEIIASGDLFANQALFHQDPDDSTRRLPFWLGPALPVKIVAKNTGKSPAFYFGHRFLIVPLGRKIESRQLEICEPLRSYKINPFGQKAFPLFPEIPSAIIDTIKMADDDVADTNPPPNRWFNSLDIVGCVDYFLAGSGKHHQTGVDVSICLHNDAAIVSRYHFGRDQIPSNAFDIAPTTSGGNYAD